MFNGADSAQNQDNANSFIATSGILPPDEFPQFESWVSAKYDRPGGPFDPHTGESYAYSQIADVSYKRLTRTINVPAGGGDVSFWTSFNTEPDWDYLFVEAHTPDGQLDDAAGRERPHDPEHRATAARSTGWRELHPFLTTTRRSRRRRRAPDRNDRGVERRGRRLGRLAGVEVNLGAYAGQQVEISITYASDWATQGPGVFVDDVTLPDGSSTSFEAGDTGGWAVSGPPPGSAPNVNNFVFTTAAGFPEGATITTEDTLLLGFGLEAVTGADARAEVMGRAMDYFLASVADRGSDVARAGLRPRPRRLGTRSVAADDGEGLDPLALHQLPARASRLSRRSGSVFDGRTFRCRPRRSRRGRRGGRSRPGRRRGPRHLPGPDSHRQAALNLSLVMSCRTPSLHGTEQSRRTRPCESAARSEPCHCFCRKAINRSLDSVRERG